MNLPMYDNGLLSGLLAGFLFGYVLEGAGFGSPRKLTGQFFLKDWSVFKIMFTAVIVAAFGLWLFETLGWMRPHAAFVPTLLIYGTVLGGALIGLGFVLGGYCPGTSAVGFASGRLDAFVFMLGMVAGSSLFAGVFDDIRGLALAAVEPRGLTLPQLFGVPAILVIAGLAVIAFLGWKVGSMVEKKFGGPYGVEEVLDSVDTGGGTRHAGGIRIQPAE